MEFRTAELSPRRKKEGYQETDFQSKFTAWDKQHPLLLPPSCGVELKVVKTARAKSLSLNDFEPQQIPSLLAVASSVGIRKKLSDLDPSRKPFDYFKISEARGLIAVEFYTKNKPHYFYLMDVHDFLQKLEKKGKNYLNEKEIAHISVRYDL